MSDKFNQITFKNYDKNDYDNIVNFLVEINEENYSHINWNWARMEWMMFHPEFDESTSDKIGLYYDKDRLVALAIFDMYFGEAGVLTLKEYSYLYKEVLHYAFTNLKDNKGLGIAALENSYEEKILIEEGYQKTDAKEEMVSLDLNQEFEVKIPQKLEIIGEDPYPYMNEYLWLFFQGFDHGDDYEEFLKIEQEYKDRRPHTNPYLSLVIKNEKGERVGCVTLWYLPGTDYAYLEPLCVIPSYRNQGLARALIYEGLNRVRGLGAKKVYVLSDMEFYKKIGFKKDKIFNFYWKKIVLDVNGKNYTILDLLGKGKGGYSYLAIRNDQSVVLKQIHHEPCSYYNFGNKIEAELNDYNRLKEAGIRIPKLIEVDKEKERIVKEYIEGETIFDLVNEDRMNPLYIEQVREMALLAKNHNLNIDYFPTNFIVHIDELFYIDYECNEYHEEWNFENWGIKYWSKTKDFIDYLNSKK